MAGSSTADAPELDAAFYFDVASPEAYLSAERILSIMPVPCEWIPVRMPFEGGFRCAEEETIFREAFERAVAERELQPVRWPDPFPFDSTLAQRAATFAKGSGKTVAFALAAFRQAYAGGRSMSDPHNVTIAGAACEFHPRALLKGAELGSTARRLDEATALARERGVRSVPAVWTPTEVFHGDALLDAAAASLAP
jgi:2-hydroxychromene-2-carboxylate isomerase